MQRGIKLIVAPKGLTNPRRNTTGIHLSMYKSSIPSVSEESGFLIFLPYNNNETHKRTGAYTHTLGWCIKRRWRATKTHSKPSLCMTMCALALGLSFDNLFFLQCAAAVLSSDLCAARHFSLSSSFALQKLSTRTAPLSFFIVLMPLCTIYSGKSVATRTES